MARTGHPPLKGMTNLLTKSKYLSGIQCHKYLWIIFNDKLKIPSTDPSTQFIYDQGYKVGEYAKSLYPSGIDVPYNSFKESIAETEKLLAKRKPLFEASVLADNLYSRVDILSPVEDSMWDIVEVKSSTSVKDVHIWDVSFQKYCCEKAGLKVRKCHLMYLNNDYVREGDLDYQELFCLEDITNRVNDVYAQIPANIKGMFETIQENNCPDISIGMHCLEPYECPLKEYCWAFLPKRNIFNLYWLGKKQKFELLEDGLETIEEIPEHYELTDKQIIQRESIIRNDAHIEHREIRAFLESLKYPLYYLDFETFNPAIPLYNGSRPYQRIPFQYSLHVVENKDGFANHFSFLADGKSDPRPDFLNSLKKHIGHCGSVIVYNQKFEEGVLNELSAAFPDCKQWVMNVIERMVDLLDPFKAFHYYHPNQNGSASLKSVLPVLTGKTYENMNIQEGEEASRTFVNTFINGQGNNNIEQVRKDLEDYCKLDTQAMIDIIFKLHKIAQ